MANLGCIEINPWNSTIEDLEKPTYTLIDLDPLDIEFSEVIKTANAVREILEESEIPSYCKTSGATGIHIYIPMGNKYNYEDTRKFAEIIAMLTNEKLPDITSVERKPEKRKGKVYLDYLQNRHGQTLASAYCVRPKPGATVSTPLKWEEVNSKLNPKNFTIKTIFRRLDKVGDLWKPTLGEGIDLNKTLMRLMSNYNKK
jgi:bifunctional non-homologous end joining protein LigD